MEKQRLIKVRPNLLNDSNFNKYDYVIASYIKGIEEWDAYKYTHYRGSIKSLCNALNLDPDIVIDSINHMIDIDFLRVKCDSDNLDSNAKTYIFYFQDNYSPLNLIDIDEETGELLS